MRLEVITLEGLPEIRAGMDLPALIVDQMESNGLKFKEGDVLALAQKIVSKAEDRFVDLASVVPSDDALRHAKTTGKDARLIELILQESQAVMRVRPGLMIVRDRRGLVLANAGIDASNVPGGRVLLLPVDPDASAARLRDALQQHAGCSLAVVILDSIGRAWRSGTVGTAIGCAGLPALLDLRGTPDRDGRTLQVTEIGLADEVAAAASLVIGQAGEGTPVALLRGVPYRRASGSAAQLQRPLSMDLFP